MFKGRILPEDLKYQIKSIECNLRHPFSGHILACITITVIKHCSIWRLLLVKWVRFSYSIINSDISSKQIKQADAFRDVLHVQTICIVFVLNLHRISHFNYVFICASEEIRRNRNMINTLSSLL